MQDVTVKVGVVLVSLREAAIAAGCTEKTIRNYIKADPPLIHFEEVQGARGPEYRVDPEEVKRVYLERRTLNKPKTRSLTLVEGVEEAEFEERLEDESPEEDMREELRTLLSHLIQREDTNKQIMVDLLKKQEEQEQKFKLIAETSTRLETLEREKTTLEARLAQEQKNAELIQQLQTRLESLEKKKPFWQFW